MPLRITLDIISADASTLPSRKHNDQLKFRKKLFRPSQLALSYCQTVRLGIFTFVITAEYAKSTDMTQWSDEPRGEDTLTLYLSG